MIIRVNSWAILFIIFIFPFIIYAQTGTSLETEIQNIEKAISARGVSAQERHAGLVRLAALRQLSGDIEGAARNWLDAARALPNRVDDDALLNCAYCLAAMGEWNRARAALEPLLAKSARARFLNTSIVSITSNNTNALAALADNPEYSPMKNEIYFLLWRLTEGRAKDTWRQRLVREFPQSPEARLAQGSNIGAEQTIALRQNPFWLLIGGLDSLALLPSETEGRLAPAIPAPATPVPVPAPQPVPTPAPQPAALAEHARLQTGIYSQSTNAQAQAQKLRQAGCTPAIEERNIGGNTMWAVTVPVSQEQALKSAGIEYFPLR